MSRSLRNDLPERHFFLSCCRIVVSFKGWLWSHAWLRPVTMCMQKERKDTTGYHGSEAQEAAAMLRGESEEVAADAPPNGASHANGKLFCQVLRSMPSHNMVLQVKQRKLVSPYSEAIEHLCSRSGGLNHMASAISLKACTDCQVCSWSAQYLAAFMRSADQCQLYQPGTGNPAGVGIKAC